MNPMDVLRCMAMGTLLAASTAMAQQFPTRPIRLVVPFAPAGGSDVVARIVAQKMSVSLGQTVVIDNRPGASGNIGADAVAKSPPDGYTVLLANNAITSNPALFKKLPFDTARDLLPVSQISTSQHLLAAHPSAPFNTLPELVAYARQNPGKVTVATAGVGQMGHLVGEMLSQASGTELLMVHYKGTGASMTDLLGAQVMTSIVSVPGVINQVESGKLKAIAVTSPKRLARLPAVPAMSETYKGLELTTWFGTFVPAGTPRPVIEKLAIAAQRALADPEVRARLAAEGMEPGSITTAEFDHLFRADLIRWKRFIDERGIHLDN
jgi:tripartite-type tricarboxylate transporter receptor subunit TctC